MQAWHMGLFCHGYSDKMQERYKVNLASGKIPLLCCTKEILLVSTQAAPIRSRLIPHCPYKSEELERGVSETVISPISLKL